MRNFYQSNTAASNNLQFGEPLSPNEHDQIVIRHDNSSLSCSFSSKNKMNLNSIKTNLPMPLMVNHDSPLNTVDYLIHNNSSYNNINCNNSGAISTKRRVKLNNYNLSSLSLASSSSLSPTSSSVSSSSSVQTKSKFINTHQSFLNMSNTTNNINNNNNNVSRPSLNHSHLNISNHLHHSNYSFINNNNNNHTDNFVSMTSTDLLPVSASSNESSSSLSSSLSVEAGTVNNSHHQITTSYVSNHIYHHHHHHQQQHLHHHHHNQQKQFQIQPPTHFSFKENNKFIVKKNSSLSSKTSSSSSSAYSSIGSTTSSPAPSPNSSCNIYFNNNNNGEDYQTIKQNAHLNSNELSHISLKDKNYEQTVNNFISLFNEQDLTQTPLDNNQCSKKTINNTTVNSKYKNHHKTLSRDCYSKMLNQEQNERFFESNTLYKKELKQKQRDLLNITVSPTATTTTNNSLTPNNQFKPSAPSPINESSAESTNSSSAFTSLVQQNSPSPLANSKDNYSTFTHLQEPSNILKSNSFSILSSQNVNFSTEPNSNTDKHKQNGFNLKKEKKSSNQSHSNKMLNLFSNLLNRNKPSSPGHLLSETNHSSEFSNTSSNVNNTSKEHGNGNYLNLKYLKRAASSTHFNNKSQNDLQLNRKSSTSKFLASAGKIAVLSDQQQQQHQLEQSIASSKDDSVCKLFNGTVNSKYNDENMNRPSIMLISTECDSQEANENRFLRSYNRRSYDDATMSLNQSDQLTDSSFSGKFENTAFSTKNNGLIFLPSPKACEPSASLLSPSGVVDTTGVNSSINENVNNYENFDPHLSVASSSKRRLSQGLLDETNQKSPVQLNIINLTCINNNNISNNSGLVTPSKPAVDREHAANSLLDDSGAFDNAVYSYVDNIRQHSKRLSEINMFSTNSPSTSSNKHNDEQNMNRQSLSIATSSASSVMNKNPVELPIVATTTNYDHVSSSSPPPPSHNLTLATDHSVIQQRSASPCIHVHENSFENQSYVRISTTGMNPKPKLNSVKLNSPASSLASSSSSSSSSNYSSNLSISPKSLVSSETIVINSNLIRTASNMNPKPVHPTTPTSNVMSLREKFEQFTDTNKSSLCNTPCSSNTKLNRNSAHILTYKEFKTNEQNNEIDSMSSSSSSSSSSHGSSKSVPHSIPIIYQSNSLTSSMSNMSKNENNNMNTNLVISTSATQISQQHAQTNSPVSTMSSVSSLSDSSIKDSVSSSAILPILANNNNNNNNDFNPTFSSSSNSSCSNYDQSDKIVPNEFDFNFLYEFFSLRPHHPENTRNTCEFYLAYEESVALFIKNYYANKCFFLHHVLNPCVIDLNNVSVSVNSSTSTDSFCFKFTIDYLKTSIFSKFKIKSVKNDLFELVSMNSNDLDDETKLAIESTNNNDCYNHLFHDLISTKETANLEQSNELDKNKLKSFIHKKISFYVKYLGKTLSKIEANNDLGKKILGLLEQNLNITCLELDKYKLLVSEIDVINNLLLKLCNKLANTENSIQIMQLKQMQDINQNLIDDFITQKFDSIPLVSIPESNEEIELLKQELNQIQRKKEEAIFLRNGIDKRATTVSDYLINYLNKDHHQEFELFIQMKSVYAVQLRHIKDHIELSQLQLKLIEDLV